MEIWEYEVESFTAAVPGDIKTKLSAMGARGWKVISVTLTQASTKSEELVVIFERRKN